MNRLYGHTNRNTIAVVVVTTSKALGDSTETKYTFGGLRTYARLMVRNMNSERGDDWVDDRHATWYVRTVDGGGTQLVVEGVANVSGVLVQSTMAL